MAEQAGFLVDQEYDDAFLADFIMSLISDGVLNGNSLAVTAGSMTGDGMSVSVSAGKAWIQGRLYQTSDGLEFPLSAADPHVPRTDCVVIRYDRLQNSIRCIVRPKGTNSCIRDLDTYELLLAEITVPAKATAVVQANIADKRLDTNVCGLVHGLIDQIDTTTLMTQLEDWAETYKTASQDEWKEWFNSIKGTTETVTDNARDAADDANQAAQRVETAITNATTAAQDANTAKEAANTAATNANAKATDANNAATVANTAADRANTAAERVESTDVGDLATRMEAVENDYVPKTRTVNKKPLSSNLTLTADDVGALAEDAVMSGQNSNGNYIKFPDGTMICHNPSVELSRQNGNVALGTWVYPAEFVSPPTISVARRTLNTNQWEGAFLKYIPGVLSETEEEDSVQCHLIGSVADGTMPQGWHAGVNVTAIGRWK